MDAMLSALRARRDGQSMMDKPVAEKEDSGGQLATLVESLSPEQKQMLMEMLSQESAQPLEVEKGAPTSEESKKIEMKMSEEPEEELAESGSGLTQDQSDDIASSMIERKHEQMAEKGAKPASLADRAKMYAFNKIKSKGKSK